MSAPSAHPNRRRSPSLPVFPHVPVSSTYSSSFATLARRQLSLARGKVYEVRKRGSSGQRKSEKWTPCLSESLQIYISVYLDSSLSCIFLLLSLNLPCWWLLSSSSLCGCWPSLRRLCALTLTLPQHAISSWAPTDIHARTRFTFEHVSWVGCVMNYCGCVRLHMCHSQM